jgi:hypothetical protein
MNTDGGSHPQFHVDCSAVVTQRCLEIERAATENGRGEIVVRAFQEIISRLKKDPHEFGEPNYNLPALRLQLRQAIVLPLAVHYAVSLDRPIVYLKGVRDLNA